MGVWSRWCAVAVLAATLQSIQVSAADYRRLDGVHRIAKKALITAPAQLLDRRDGEASGTCASDLSLCAAEFDGGCCPGGYECAKESCYATTKGPSTCGGKVGYHACPLANGGGCCPDGLICDGGIDCIPPSGSAYTFGCPASYFLCPSSVNYGCCPSGMGCAAKQCYATEVQTVTTDRVITTTRGDGDETTITSRQTSVRTPSAPTALPTADNENQKQLKFFPSAVPKVTADAASEDGGDGGGGGGLSKGALGGIVAGAVIFLIVVVAGAWFILRRLNKVAAAVHASQHSKSSRGRPQPPMRQPTESEMDGVSVDRPLMVSPPTSVSPGHGHGHANFRYGRPTPDPSVHSQAPSSFAGAYQAVSPGEHAQPTFDMAGNIIGYFDHPPMKPRRTPSNAQSLPRVSEDSQGAGGSSHAHGRQRSDGSDASDEPGTFWGKKRGGARASVRELEGEPYVPELAGSPPGFTGSPPGFVVSPLEESDATFSSFQPLHIPRKKSNSIGSAGPSTRLGAVDEEASGYGGPSFRIMGQPAYQPVMQGLDEDEQRGAGPGYYGR
jgi:hypothetical protein